MDAMHVTLDVAIESFHMPRAVGVTFQGATNDSRPV
jgi:hypothetical protein